MPIDAQKLAEELDTFGFTVDDSDLLDKLQELCIVHGLTEEKMASEWMAFSYNKSLELCVDTLERFDHEHLAKRSNSRTPTQNKIFQDANTLSDLIAAEDEEDDLMDSYTTPAKASQKRQLTTPENPQSKRILSQSSHLSPSSFSPSTTPSQKYSSRKNPGELVVTFGSEPSGTSGRAPVRVHVFSRPGGEPLSQTYLHMFQKLHDVREVFNQQIEDLGQQLQAHYNVEELTSVTNSVQSTVTVLGRICCDCNGKLNAKSVLFQGDLDISAGLATPLDLSEIPEFSLFPGQVAMLDGLNPTGKKFVASKLYEAVPLPFYCPEPEEEENISDGSVTMLVACGPFSTSDSINYEPLCDLITVINHERPQVCLLMGPFVDAKHEHVEKCQLKETFAELFANTIRLLVERTQSSGSRLVIVPSLRDVHHCCIYPQPPFTPPDFLKGLQRVTFVSEPCTLNVNGVVVGVTSTDILLHMSSEEISPPGGVDRFTRLVTHLLTQRSYYPLYPPAEEMNVNYETVQVHARFPVTPDVLIIPSDLRYFVKTACGCVCINPGRLTKGHVGGTFARIALGRVPSTGTNRVSPCLSAQIIKI
ncbi:DNA polymerase alpha subunit B [Lampetra planeri]